MADVITIEIQELSSNINVAVATVTNTFVVEVSEVGSKGDKGDAGATFTDLQLKVTVENQTEFNIFSIPQQSNLFINDLQYFENKSYQITQNAGIYKLLWLNEFDLKTTDFIIIRKFTL